MPHTSARGSHAFSPMNSVPPSQLPDADEDIEEGHTGADSGSRIRDTEEDAMDIDKEGDSSTFASLSTFKRKHTTFASDEDTLSVTSQKPPSSVAASTSSASPSNPAVKRSIKSSSSIATSSKRKLKSQSAPSLPSSRSSKTKTKLSPELLVHEMQGSINQLTAAVRDSMDTDPVTKVRQEAVQRMELVDEGLTPEQKVFMLHQFTNNHASAQVYLVIEDEGLRKAWLQSVCNK